MKKKVLALVNAHFSTHTARLLEICKKLRESDNYNISISGRGEFMKFAYEDGFRCIDTETLTKEEMEKIAHSPIPMLFTKKSIEKYYSIEKKILEEEKPDIILREISRECAGIVAKKQGIFDISLLQANFSPFYKVLSFRSVNFPKQIDWLPYLSFIAPAAESTIRRCIYGPLHEKVKNLDLKVIEHTLEGIQPDLTLYPDSEILFPCLIPKKYESYYKYIGPPFRKKQSEPPKWIEEFKKDKRKKILISNGTTGVHEKNDFFIKSLKDKNYAVAFYTNNKTSLPTNFYGGKKFDIEEVLENSDVFIMHGGIGSTYLGLIKGVPMIGLFNHFEQQINIHQLELLKAGIGIHPKELTTKKLIENIEILLNDKSYKENSKKTGEEIKKMNPPELALKFIEERLAHL